MRTLVVCVRLEQVQVAESLLPNVTLTYKNLNTKVNSCELIKTKYSKQHFRCE